MKLLQMNTKNLPHQVWHEVLLEVFCWDRQD